VLHGDEVVVTDDDVTDEFDVEEGAGFADEFGGVGVLVTGFRIARGVVVGENDG